MVDFTIKQWWELSETELKTPNCETIKKIKHKQIPEKMSTWVKYRIVKFPFQEEGLNYHIDRLFLGTEFGDYNLLTMLGILEPKHSLQWQTPNGKVDFATYEEALQAVNKYITDRLLDEQPIKYLSFHP